MADTFLHVQSAGSHPQPQLACQPVSDGLKSSHSKTVVSLGCKCRHGSGSHPDPI